MSYQFSPANCTENFITIGDRECDFIPSVSGLYLSDLSGVNLELLTNLADGRYSNAVDYAGGILRRAALYSQDQIKQILAGAGYQVLQGTSKASAVPSCSFLTSTSAGANGRGLVCRKVAAPPKFSVFYILQIQAKTAQSGPAVIEIKNSFGDVLWSKNIQLTAHQVLAVPVMQEFDEPELFIELQGNPAPLDAYNTFCAKSELGCCGKSLDKQFYTVTGWDGLQPTANSFGLVLLGGVQCSFAQVFCSILPYIAEAVLNLCHAAILDDILATPRINYSTLYADADAITKQAEIARNRAKKSMAAQVGSMLEGLQHSAPICISCNKQTNARFVSRV